MIEAALNRLFPNTMMIAWLDGFTSGVERGRREARNEIVLELDRIKGGEYDLPIGINREATIDLIVNKAIEIAIKNG